MQSENKVNQSCENCKFFVQHYAKKSIKIFKVFCGHCMNRNAKAHKKKPIELCQFWEELAIKKEERKMSIKKTIETMAERLIEISMVLETDFDVNIQDNSTGEN